jgi:hypothetical protein
MSTFSFGIPQEYMKLKSVDLKVRDYIGNVGEDGRVILK